MRDTPVLNLTGKEEPSGWVNFSASGDWSLAHLAKLETVPSNKSEEKLKGIILSGKEVQQLDTSGAMMLFQLAAAHTDDSDKIRWEDFSDKHKNILELVRPHASSLLSSNQPAKDREGYLAALGRKAGRMAGTATQTLGFMGKTFLDILQNIIRPGSFRIKEFFVQIEQVFLLAIPIIILVTFMIGVVIAYISASQIEKYGAGIFIVDGIALAMLRELSPVIVAIVVAGRSGSAFTAQLGTMKMNEEVDAITTLGLSPFQVLVVPRVLALILTMPLLVFIGDVTGVLAGMFIADYRLGITPSTFIDRFQTVVPVRWVMLGLGKAPVFAALIAIIACRNGMNTENNARSVGLSTTATVVQSIVAVIIVDAIFAVVFQELKL